MWFGLWMSVMGAWAAPDTPRAVHLARVQDGIVEVALPGVVEDWKSLPWRAKKVEGHNVWSVTMKTHAHSGVRIGDRFNLHDPRKDVAKGSCKVVSFVTRSVAYNDWERENPTQPDCGTPQVYAQLDCTGKGYEIFIATPRGIKVTAFSPIADTGNRHDRRATQALSTPEIMAEIKADHAQANDPGAPVKVTDGVADLKDHPDLWLIDVHRFTGDGVEECGGGDLSDKRWALWDGTRVVGPIHRYVRRPIAMLTVGGQPYMLRSLDGAGWALTDLAGEPSYRMHDGFCGCPC